MCKFRFGCGFGEESAKKLASVVDRSDGRVGDTEACKLSDATEDLEIISFVKNRKKKNVQNSALGSGRESVTLTANLISREENDTVLHVSSRAAFREGWTISILSS